VIQICELVEEFLKIKGYFKKDPHTGGMRRIQRVTNRLSMYVGFKFMITDKCVPNPSLNQKKKRVRDKSGNLVVIPEFTETKNGQIEVVKSMKLVTVPKTRGKCWLIECEPRGKCVQGAKLLISRKLHVDPSKVYPAWAVTTNKSMGGECRNVGVYIPPRIEMSAFDRSNLYVAVSRPTHFLCVIGNQPDIDTLIMRDPRPIQVCVYDRETILLFLTPLSLSRRAAC
jgi:hypothetical protein